MFIEHLLYARQLGTWDNSGNKANIPVLIQLAFCFLSLLLETLLICHMDLSSLFILKSRLPKTNGKFYV